jgi:hypothetical protein
MLRLAELALFLAPFVLFAVWRLLATEGGPSVRVIIGAACALAVMAGGLIWLSQEDTVPSGSRYEPAQFQNGKIVSHQAAPR